MLPHSLATFLACLLVRLNYIRYAPIPRSLVVLVLPCLLVAIAYTAWSAFREQVHLSSQRELHSEYHLARLSFLPADLMSSPTLRCRLLACSSRQSLLSSLSLQTFEWNGTAYARLERDLQGGPLDWNDSPEY
jgi:hypothetical protein